MKKRDSFFYFNSDGFRSLSSAMKLELRSWFFRSVQAGFALDEEAMSGEIICAASRLPENSYEKMFLDGLFLMARNEDEDVNVSSQIFGRMVRDIEKNELPESTDIRHVSEFVFEMYALVLYAHASSYYYRERDLRALRVFSRCREVLSARGRRSICSVVFAQDVRRKVDAIAFRYDSKSGYGQAIRLMRSGDYSGAIRLFDRVIGETKCDCLDHDVLLVAATAHLLCGHAKKGLALAKKANAYTRCIEAQFVYALALLMRNDKVSRRKAIGIFEDCANVEAKFRCSLPSTRQKRIRRVADDLLGCFCRSDAEAEQRESDFVQGSQVNVPKCLSFVYPAYKGALRPRAIFHG